MVLRQSDIGNLYLNEEMKALRCIREAVDALDETDPVAAGFWIEEAGYHAQVMRRLKSKFDSIIEE